MTEPKVSERMRSMVREMLKEIRHDSRFNVMDYDSVDHLLSAIAEIEQRAGEVDFFASIAREHYADIVMPTVEDRSTAKPSDWINCAILELGNQHERAKKWKEIALTHVALIQSLSGPIEGINAASKKTVDACKALGDEWDEAVR